MMQSTAQTARVRRQRRRQFVSRVLLATAIAALTAVSIRGLAGSLVNGGVVAAVPVLDTDD